MKDFVGEEYNSHDAVGDVTALSKLLNILKVQKTDFINKAYPSSSPYLQQLFIKSKNQNAPSLEILQSEGIIKRGTLENIAGSGLNLSHLKLIYKRDGEDGLRNVLSMKNSIGQCRCIERKATLEDVVGKMSTYFSK